ncbi:MAG: hypothetical protein J5613_04185 [Alphaproteobacteria bacterium]|nr:hypothetical protein [Alphaproteobacteria bacterium]
MKKQKKSLTAYVITGVVVAVVTCFTTWYFTRKHYKNIYEPEYTTEITCKDGASPDINGCCPGEEFKDMGEQGFNCCPLDGGDCFPPIAK